MKDILAARNRTVLEQLAGKKLLLGFDFDGTLAPIVPRPDQVRMRAPTRRLFERVTEHYPSAVISGRARADVVRFIGDANVSLVVGNHGMEWDRPHPGSDKLLARVQRWRQQLERELAAEAGIQIEDKRFSLSVHYRHAPDPEGAERRIGRLLGTLKGSRAQGGKCVFNVLPEKSADKGTAVTRAMKLLGCEHALFIGDDVTDEDAFALEPSGRVTGIRIGRKRGSAASWFVSGQEEIDGLLKLLLVLRATRAAPRRIP